jgi:hypothetical protein
MFKSLIVASLFLLSVAYAGVPQELQAQINVLVIKDNVREAMANYAFRFDHFIAVCGAANNQSNPACPAALDVVMTTFCPDLSFEGWNDFFAGFVVPTQATRGAVRSFYAALPASMNGLSNHQVFPGPVSVAQDRRSATFVGKLTHAGLDAAGQISFDYGTYTNTFKVNPVDLSVCMSSFSLMTSHVGVPSGVAVKDTSRI